MKRVDLHTHTTASDGALTPEELVRYACQKGASAIAVTDHDTVDGLARASAEAASLGLRLVPGIELTTKRDGCEIHIVGLFVDYTNPSFARRVRELASTRDVRNAQMVQKLRDAHFNITPEDLERFRGCVLTKAHIGQILVERGYAPDLRTAMNTYLRKGGVAYVERQCPDPVECIRLVHEAGGLAIVAHTNQIDSQSRDHSCEVCATLLRLGADGLETRYCEFDQDWRDRTEALAQHFGKLRSGGSDFHGSFKKGLDLLDGYGDLEVPLTFLEAMDAARG